MSFVFHSFATGFAIKMRVLELKHEQKLKIRLFSFPTVQVERHIDGNFIFSLSKYKEEHQLDHSKVLVVCVIWYISEEIQSVS